MRLADLQDLFWRAARFDPMPPEVEGAFVARGALSARDRLKIYQDGYWYRQVDALFDCFPGLARALGHERFTRLCCRYIERHPSGDPVLERLGRCLADFLRREGEPRLGDLAALEQARLDALLAPHSPTASMQGLDLERFAFARVSLSSAVVSLSLRRDAVSLWLDPAAPDDPAPCPVAAWRKLHTVQHSVLDEDEARALDLARQGASVAGLCEAFLGSDSPEQRAFRVLSSWFARRWVASVSYPEDPPPLP